MARTACWRMLDGKVVEKVVDGLEVPDGWYDNPRLEENTPQPAADEITMSIPAPKPEVVTNVTDEKVSEPEPEPEPETEVEGGGEPATE